MNNVVVESDLKEKVTQFTPLIINFHETFYTSVTLQNFFTYVDSIRC